MVTSGGPPITHYSDLGDYGSFGPRHKKFSSLLKVDKRWFILKPNKNDDGLEIMP